MSSIFEYYCQKCQCTFFDPRSRTKIKCPVCQNNRHVEMIKEIEFSNKEG